MRFLIVSLVCQSTYYYLTIW